VMPRLASAARTAPDKPRSAKDCWDKVCDSLRRSLAANDSGGDG
jgi:hypothetical protein